MAKKWYVKGEDGRLTLYDDEDVAKGSRRGSQSWGVLEMTTLPDAPTPTYSRPPEASSYSYANGHGTSCPCRSCQMEHHGGW